MLIIDNFIPPEDKQKVQGRAVYDEDEDMWTLSPFSKAKYVTYNIQHDVKFYGFCCSLIFIFHQCA